MLHDAATPDAMPADAASPVPLSPELVPPGPAPPAPLLLAVPSAGRAALALYRRLRTADAIATLPTVLLSAVPAAIVAARTADCPPEGLVHRPCPPSAVLAVVADAMAGRGARGEAGRREHYTICYRHADRQGPLALIVADGAGDAHPPDRRGHPLGRRQQPGLPAPPGPPTARAADPPAADVPRRGGHPAAARLPGRARSGAGRGRIDARAAHAGGDRGLPAGRLRAGPAAPPGLPARALRLDGGQPVLHRGSPEGARQQRRHLPRRERLGPQAPRRVADPAQRPGRRPAPPRRPRPGRAACPRPRRRRRAALRLRPAARPDGAGRGGAGGAPQGARRGPVGGERVGGALRLPARPDPAGGLRRPARPRATGAPPPDRRGPGAGGRARSRATGRPGAPLPRGGGLAEGARLRDTGRRVGAGARHAARGGGALRPRPRRRRAPGARAARGPPAGARSGPGGPRRA